MARVGRASRASRSAFPGPLVAQLTERPGTGAAVLLLGATAAWGATFVVVKDAISHTGVLSFLAWRFLVGGGLLVALRPGALVRLGRRGWAKGAGLGLALAAGYILQTVGLRYTSAAVSGFLTGLQVVFTPLLAWSLLRRRPDKKVGAATLMALLGLAVMSLRGFSIGGGEMLTVAAAALFALQIVGLGRWSSVREAYGLAAVQLLTVAGCCWLASLPSGGPSLPAGTLAWAEVAGTAIVATAVAFVVQTWAQSQLSTAAAAIILTMEPVFAALTAGAAGEKVGWPVLVGGGLVVTAMVVVGPVPRRARAPLTGTPTTGARGRTPEANLYDRLEAATAAD